MSVIIWIVLAVAVAGVVLYCFERPPGTSQFYRLMEIVREERSNEGKDFVPYTSLHVATGDYIPPTLVSAARGFPIELDVLIEDVRADGLVVFKHVFDMDMVARGRNVSGAASMPIESAREFYRGQRIHMKAVVESASYQFFDILSITFSSCKLASIQCGRGGLRAELR